MTKLLLINNDENAILHSVEDKLLRMQHLHNEKKIIEAEYNMLKEQVIDMYFNTYDEYKTDKGLTLATYKAVESLKFQSKEFKEDHPDVYNDYSKKCLSYTFLLK